MFFGIINSILGALGDIVYKKSLSESEGKISSKYYQFIGYLLMSIALTIASILYSIEKIDIITFCIIFISSLFAFFSELTELYAYKNEKISVLVPYGEFQSIFTIIIGFFLFNDNTLNSFIFAILAGTTLVAGAIDIKNFKFNRYCLAMIVSSILGSLRYILYGYLILKISEFTIVFYTQVILAIVLALFITKKKELKQYKKINKKLGFLILLENIIRLLVGLITLTLIKELGLVQAILIGMMYLIATLIFSFIVFRDIPSKKDIIIVIFVFIFISCGTIFG